MIGKCPPIEALEAIAAGDDSSEVLRAHTERCLACRAQLQAFRSSPGPLTAASLNRGVPEPTLAAWPAVVPGFALLEEISRGGQGIVYRAVQTATKRPAAVKMLLWGAFSTERQRNRFEREIEIAARLRHPNIVTIFESGVSTDGRRYVAMEYVEGRPLDRYVQSELADLPPRMRSDRVLDLIAQIASAVGHAHASGVIHRDIKPSNILVDSAGVPRILDFGLAREVESISDISLTQEFVGTPAYAAPEQFAGDPAAVDARSDVYSLGVLLYSTLTGVTPYPGSGPLAATIEHIRSTNPAPPSRHVPGVPVDIDVMVLQALAKDPARRYATAQALAADLADFRAGRPISARRDSTIYVLRKLAARHRVPVAAGAITLLVIVAAVVVLALLSRGLDQQRRIAEAALAESNLQRSRLLVRTGGMLQAEQLLWREAQQAKVVVNDRMGLEDAAYARRVSWAMLELYSQLPRIMAAPADDAPARVGYRASDQSIWSMSIRGALERWARDGSRLEEGLRLPVDSSTGRWNVSRDGGRAFYLDPPGVRVFDLSAGGAPVALELPETLRLAVAEDGRTIVCVGSAAAQVIDVETRATLATIEGDYTAAELHRRYLALASDAAEQPGIRLFSRANWRQVATLTFPGFRFDRRFQGVSAVSPDERFVVVQSEGALFLFGLPQGGAPLAHQLVDSPFGSQPQFSGDGRSVLTVSQDGTLTLWHVPELTPARVIRNPATVSASEFCEPWVVTGHVDGTIAKWHIADDPWPRRLPATEETTTHGLALHPDGALLAAGDEFGRLTLMRIDQSEPIVARIQAHASRIAAIDFAPAGDRLVTAGKDGALRLWETDGRPIGELPASGGEFWSVRFSPDGRWIAACRANGDVLLWDAAGRSVPRKLELHRERVPEIRFSPDSRFLVSVASLGAVALWDVPRAALVREFGTPVRHTRIAAISPDGQTIAVGADDRTIRIWDANTGLLLRTLNDLPWGPFDLQYHPSGKLLFVVGRGSEIIVVDPRACCEIANFPAHDRLIFKIRLDRAGRRLFTAGEDDWIGVWDIDHLRRCVQGNAQFRGRGGGSATQSFSTQN